jgi:membrane protease YdiL (CAAX protease family)
MRIKPVIMLPILAIFIAEAFLFFKSFRYGIGIHIITLLALSLTAYKTRDTKLSNALQALALLPLFRILNTTMPIFFSQTLYVFPMVYGPIFISLYYVAKNQNFTKRELGIYFGKPQIYIPVSIVLGLLLGKMEYNIITVESLIPVATLKNILILTFVMIIFTGLPEELLFRGILQTRLEQSIGLIGGLVITSFLFGAMHSGYGSIYEIMFTTSAGFLLGYIFQRTRNLPFIALTHGMINVFLFGLIPLRLI